MAHRSLEVLDQHCFMDIKISPEGCRSPMPKRSFGSPWRLALLFSKMKEEMLRGQRKRVIEKSAFIRVCK
jgi:hypothetical protein